MSLSNAAEADVLKLLFQNTTWANVGDATGLVGSGVAGNLYVSLHTADPGETGDQTTSETAYTNYARVAVVRSASGWTVSGTAPTQVANAAAVAFATCGASGATLTHFAIGRASSGAGEILVSGALTAPLTVSSGVTPSFAIGALVVTAD
jgi:hypothetical protein